MAKPPTLIDHLVRASFRNEPVLGWANNARWRQLLQGARRFVLDDAMSTFLGELGAQAFARPLTQPQRDRMAEHLRMGARLPFPVTWIEYNLRLSKTRASALLGQPFDPAGTPRTEGWLLQQHPQLATAFIAHLVSHDPEQPDDLQFDTWTFPVAITWTADMDTVLPWRPLPLNPAGLSASEAAVGLRGYRSERVGYHQSGLVVRLDGIHGDKVAGLIAEWRGVLRYIWALLATLGDLPVQMREVRPSKGFVAKLGYHRFLAHQTITLAIPAKDYTKVARRALALAHRRAHEVRQHWRHDWRHPLSPRCEHVFTANETHQTCTLCHGRKTWIRKHERGDASLGFVTHDFRLTHTD